MIRYNNYVCSTFNCSGDGVCMLEPRMRVSFSQCKGGGTVCGGSQIRIAVDSDGRVSVAITRKQFGADAVGARYEGHIVR
jgi:hypothetical protein